MKVIECLQKSNKINVITTYEKLFPYEEYDWLQSRNLNNIYKRNNYLSFVYDDILNKYGSCFLNTETQNVLFIIEQESTNLEDKTTEFFFANLNIQNLKIPFNMKDFDNRSFCFTTNLNKNKELLNYEVSQVSIDEYGIDICATVILFHLIAFGYRENDIERIEKNIEEKIKKGMEDIEKGNFITEEEMKSSLDSLREEIYKEANAYEKALIDADDLKDNYLEVYKEKYRKEKSNKNIDFIKEFIEIELKYRMDKNMENKEKNLLLEEFTKKLNNVEYEDLYRVIKENTKFAKENNIVIVYGISDDLLEMEGAFFEEYSAFDGTKIYADLEKGLFVQEDDIKELENKTKNDFPYYLNAFWCKNEIPWTIETNIPHKTFDILEDKEIFSRGIVFFLNQ